MVRLGACYPTLSAIRLVKDGATGITNRVDIQIYFPDKSKGAVRSGVVDGCFLRAGFVDFFYQLL